MKTLYLVRHAKSSWVDEGLKDIDRPLQVKGVNDAYIIGSLLKQKNISPDLIISSTAARAIHTAIIIMRQMVFSRDQFQIQPTIYESSTEGILGLLLSLNNSINSVMLFGHNPTFTSLTNAFANSNYANIPTCGIAGIDFTIDYWNDLKFGSGKISLYEIPKTYR